MSSDYDDDDDVTYDSESYDDGIVESDDDEELQFSGGEEADGVRKSSARPQTIFQTLTPDMLSKKMFDIVNDVNAVFQLPTPYVRILLTTCKWDKERLLERYYTGDQEALFKEAHLVYPKLRSKPAGVRAQQTSSCGAAASAGNEYICDICMMSYPQSDMNGLECGHLFCRNCWDSYLNVMIMCEGRGQRIYCPATACDIVVNEQLVLELLRKADVKMKFQHLITNSFVQDHPSLKWCPAPGCLNAVHATTVDHSPVTCLCGHSFCFHCGRDSHEPIRCEYLTKWLKKCDDDSETSNWIHVNTKECPKCRATIEKNGGCNHMCCSTCKAEFCWQCLGPWDPHGSSWYKCNRYNEKESQDARDAQAKSRAALERYLFYCNRYMNHLKSSKMEHKLYEMTHQKMQELQKLSMSWVEVQFLKQAVDVLCQCRETLMFTYAFAYFLIKNNHTLIFEDNQSDLEMATEMLSEYLERDITKDSVAKMKVLVQDKTKYCQSRRQAVLDYVYEGYDLDLWEYTE